MRNLNGWLVIDKPLHMSSTDVVNRVKRLLRPKKIGHAGTLDPMASGVLVLALGEATKLIDIVMRAKKSYEFTIAWGEERDTMDAEGEVIATSDHRPDLKAMKLILESFIPGYWQTPPKYSAVKINGERAYALVRQGKEFEIQPKWVDLYKIEIIHHEVEATSFYIECGKGFYVRSLAYDIACKVDTVGYVSHLRRGWSSKFGKEHMISLESLEEVVYKEPNQSWENFIYPITAMLDDILVWQISEGDSLKLKQGQSVPYEICDITHNEVIAVSYGIPVAICEVKDGFLKPKRVFNL